MLQMNGRRQDFVVDKARKKRSNQKLHFLTRTDQKGLGYVVKIAAN